MKGIWGWVSLFLFSIYLGAIGANAELPQSAHSHSANAAFVDSLEFQAIFARAARLNSTDEDADPNPNQGLEFCKTEKWAVTCLNLLLTYRCNGYSFPLPAAGCSSAGDAFVKLLSMKKIDVKIPGPNGTIETYNLPVIFTNELQVLIQEPKVQAYIEGLMPTIRNAEKNNLKFSLYEHTLSKTGNNPVIAMGLLAVLFQDTSFVQIQAAYLEQLITAKLIKEDTRKFIQQIRYVSEYLDYPNMNEVNKTGWFDMYPRIGTLNKTLNYSLYHFYPMAYTASLLSENHSTRLAFFIPFLFNTDYEFQDLDPEMWPFNHPRPFKLTPELDWKMRDIYGGLVGAQFGAGTLTEAGDVPDFTEFKTDLAQDPKGEMKSWFWSNFL